MLPGRPPTLRLPLVPHPYRLHPCPVSATTIPCSRLTRSGISPLRTASQSRRCLRPTPRSIQSACWQGKRSSSPRNLPLCRENRRRHRLLHPRRPARRARRRPPRPLRMWGRRRSRATHFSPSRRRLTRPTSRPYSIRRRPPVRSPHLNPAGSRLRSWNCSMGSGLPRDWRRSPGHPSWPVRRRPTPKTAPSATRAATSAQMAQSWRQDWRGSATRRARPAKTGPTRKASGTRSGCGGMNPKAATRIAVTSSTPGSRRSGSASPGGLGLLFRGRFWRTVAAHHPFAVHCPVSIVPRGRVRRTSVM